MGYYKDTGSLRSMASAEAILKKRMPEKEAEKIGIPITQTWKRISRSRY